ncbi:MAG: cysteine desulfurase family protein, partial [Acidimicrobiales bacterium]
MTTTYLDHAATTPVRPDAFEAMLPWLRERYGNPSGSHSFARAARKAIDEARDVVAECLGCMPREIVFTSGGTEADNLAVTGVVGQRRGTVVCSAVEHHAVLDAVEALGGRTVGVDPGGRLDLDELVEVLDDEVCLVSVMLANNEVGTIQPVAEVVRLVAEHAPGAVVHSDVVQAIPWLDVADLAAGVDLLALSAHKFGGPQGVGALAIREGITLTPLLRGGGQERERRSGTQNVAGIVGMAAALAATVRERTSTVARVARLRDRLADGLTSTVAGCTESGDRSNKVAGSCSLLLADVETEALLVLMDQAGICATAGSSCASGAMAPSHVLRAMGVS